MLDLVQPLTRTEKVSLCALVVLLTVGAWVGAIGCQGPRTFQGPDYRDTIVSEATLGTLAAGQRLDNVATKMRPRYKGSLLGNELDTGPFLVAQSKFGDRWIRAYEVEVESDAPTLRRERAWLFYDKDRFVRWGPPGDWPAPDELADLMKNGRK